MEWLDPHCAQLKISLRNPWDLKVQDVLAHNEVYDANPPPNVGKSTTTGNTWTNGGKRWQACSLVGL